MRWTWAYWWALKIALALGVWYGIDDRIASHFGISALGNIPWLLVLGVMFFISLSAEQFSVVRVLEAQR
jgi:hypothetical protein